jgi:hypothetical protein
VAENENKEFWDRVETVGSSLPARPTDQNQILQGHTAVPPTMDVPVVDTETPRGIIMQWKKNAIDRKATLQAIEAQYNSQLDALRYHLGKAVSVSNARADRIAEEFLKQLDSEHIQVLKELGLRNAEVRATALIEIREMIFKKLKELETKKWPQPLIDRTLEDLFDLEKRVSGEMMKELGQ